ncbi:MAG: hypothetical protein QM692_08735 [Thermomicrobiales bacterium]
MSATPGPVRPGVVTAPLVETYPAPAVDLTLNEPLRRDAVRWGPILAGVVTGFAVLLFMAVLGLALGLSALGSDSNPRGWGTAAGIWGAVSALLAFFFGGWMAGRGSAPGPERSGLLNGFVTGAATLLLILWMATTAVTGTLGFFAGTVTGLASSAAPVAMQAVDQAPAQEVDQAADEAQATVTQAGEQVQEALPDSPQQAAAEATAAAGNAAPGAWGTALAVLLAIAAAVFGGHLGQPKGVLVVDRAAVVRP